MRRSVFADVVELIFSRFAREAFGPTADLAGLDLAGLGDQSRFVSAVSSAQGDETRVKGVQGSGTADGDRDGSGPRGTAALTTPFGDIEASSDDPLALLLLIIAVSVSALFLARRILEALR